MPTGISVFPLTIYRQAPQKGSTTLSATQTSNTTTLGTAVGPNAYIEWGGNVFALGGGSPGEDLPTHAMASAELTNTTTVTVRRGEQSDANTNVVYWAVVDPN